MVEERRGERKLKNLTMLDRERGENMFEVRAVITSSSFSLVGGGVPSNLRRVSKQNTMEKSSRFVGKAATPGPAYPLPTPTQPRAFIFCNH